MPMNPRLLRPLASGVHPEANAWRTAVVANGGSVSASTMRAVSKFCADIDAAGIRDRFYRLNLFAGTGLNACLVPLYRGQSRTGTQYGNATDTNNNFVSGDYSEVVGLNANGSVGSSNKYLDTGLSPDDLPSIATGHIGVFADPLAHNNLSNQIPIGTRAATPLFRMRVRFDGTLDGGWSTGVAAITTSANTTNALYLTSRTLQNMLDVYIGTSSVANSINNTAPASTGNDFVVFNERLQDGTVVSGGGFPGVISAYSIGSGMSGADITSYHAALTTFLAAIGRPTT
jgi:hypothetical protein